MKIAEFLSTILWFQTPDPGRHRGARCVHASRWQRWRGAAIQDAGKEAGEERLHFRIFAALRKDIVLALVAIGVHTAAAFVSAITLKSLLAQLIQGDSAIMSNVALGATCMALTYCAWLALNHTFFLAELVGVGGRSYVEQRLLLKKNNALGGWSPLNLTTLFDREAARVESSWSGLITISLALATVIFTSTFFFFALGVSALAALAVIAVSSLAVYWMAQRLSMTYAQLSLNATQRIEIGAFATKNRRQAWLKNWKATLISDYTDKRNLEAASLKQAARLVAAISLISTMTPIVALLSAASLQLVYLGHIDAPGVLAAIALIGGLRSVANNIPDIVQSISQGFVGHKNIEYFLCAGHADSLPLEPVPLPTTHARHIAIVGAAGSGKTSVLRTRAQCLDDVDGRAIFIPDEPWIFAGGLRENLSLYRRDFSGDEACRALALSRLPEHFCVDYLGELTHGAEANWDVSRGQGKRLELARALVAQPQWIFIDQPTSGLDEDLAAGLLVSLLQGPWRDTNVIFVTDKQEEKAAAHEIWTVADGSIAHVKTHQLAAHSGLAETCTENLTPDFPTDEAEPHSVPEPSQPTATRSRSITRSLLDFGLWKITLIALVLFALKEVFTIAGDYIIASGYLTTHLQLSLIGLASVLVVSAVLSIFGALITVRKSIDVASTQCIHYFSNLMNPGLDHTLAQEVNRDSHNKLTWDQRRVDEVLPVLLLETVGAATLLSITIGYVMLNNLYVLPPFIVIGLCYWYGARQSGELLQRSNTREIDATSTLFSRVQALNWAGGRFDNAHDNSMILDWLSPSLATRAFASLDNAATRRRYSYKLDLMGVFFLSAIVASTIYFHATGTVSMANVLAVSLSYSLIAIFARLGRCLVELRQVLDSADRLVGAGLQSRTSPVQTKIDLNAPLVSFSDVTFINPNSGSTVLEQFNQSFHENEVVVIMGASGVGKSTFADLVVGSLAPSQGQISTLGDTDGYLARQHAEEVQLLTSNPVFKPGSLALHFNNPSLEELNQRAAYLGLSDIVEQLQDGFNQHIPWNGEISLSKSELQRLALLDLTLNTPAIVILDEATSELNSADEVQLMHKLISALPNTLFFIITHNPELCALGSRNFNFNHEKRLVEKTA
ncbi:ABC-type multidrug transport system, ATPase and permease component [Pseudomonas sp. GM18]|uniref:ATP-binding cassette domain-containing protein n=1 Tax=Pseudomonas sp. GM18 TaxID=1144324 RepID=UPI00027281B9|nr:ATP-binding cassette domain-containing protein [Pseudomonas sp. GM18]EJM12490.1 ABC-type multidrug transport system, ATPase and permease component [Pseudomonas sp. GM18]